MQPWPVWPFGRVRDALVAAGCKCELAIPAGATTALDGVPTPAVYGFTREVSGELRLATIVAYDEDDLIPYNDLRSACDALGLELAMFGPIH